MKRAIASVLTLFCVACGGGNDDVAPPPGAAQPPPAQGGLAASENEPPVIVSAALEPATAGAADAISVALVARDPDQDRVRTTVEWYRNGELVEDLSDMGVPAGTFARGDRVYAIVYATDGHHDVSAQTATLSIGNSAPRVTALKITPERATALDLLQVEAEVNDADGDHCNLSYRWLRNGEPVAEATNSRFAPGLAHRGDTITVQVQANDGSDAGGWTQSKPFVLANAPPSITSQPNYTLAGSGQYSYEVGAQDPDGDKPLRYEVVQGPPGMTVDVTSGLVTWRVPSDAKGVYPIEVSVSDPFGGKTTQAYQLAVDWDEGGKAAKAKGAKSAAPAAAQESASGQNTKPPAAKSAADEGDGDYTDQDQEGEAEEDEF